jgi:hypothetical protein
LTAKYAKYAEMSYKTDRRRKSHSQTLEHHVWKHSFLSSGFPYSASFAVLFRSGFVAQISTFYAETQDAVAR